MEMLTSNFPQAIDFKETERPMRIALDMDGVLANTHGVHYKLLSKKYGVDIPPNFAYQWDAEKCLKHIVGLEITGQEFLESFSELWQDWESIPVQDEFAPWIVMELSSNLGFDVDIVTYARGDQMDCKMKWLEKNINYPESLNVVNSAKSDKWKYHADYEIFIDDCPHIAVGATALGKVGILYNQPWNLGVSDSLISTRVLDLKQSVEFLEGFQKGYYGSK